MRVRKAIGGLSAAVLVVAFLAVLTTALPTQATMVNHVTYNTAPQVIPLGVTSGVITIQTQDIDGVSVPVGVTSDLTLSSSSATGEFSSSATNWATDNVLTMSSSWANRSFYYRDSTAGNFVLIAILTERQPNGSSWQAAQAISVIPEPANLALLAFGSLTILFRKRA